MDGSNTVEIYPQPKQNFHYRYECDKKSHKGYITDGNGQCPQIKARLPAGRGLDDSGKKRKLYVLTSIHRFVDRRPKSLSPHVLDTICDGPVKNEFLFHEMQEDSNNALERSWQLDKYAIRRIKNKKYKSSLIEKKEHYKGLGLPLSYFKQLKGDVDFENRQSVDDSAELNTCLGFTIFEKDLKTNEFRLYRETIYSNNIYDGDDLHTELCNIKGDVAGGMNIYILGNFNKNHTYTVRFTNKDIGFAQEVHEIEIIRLAALKFVLPKGPHVSGGDEVDVNVTVVVGCSTYKSAAMKFCYHNKDKSGIAHKRKRMNSNVEDSQPIVFSNNTELNVRQPEPNGELSPNSYQLSNACANEVPTEDGENLTSDERPTTSNNYGPLTNLPSVNNESILDVEDSQPIVFSNNTELNVRQPEPNGELSPNSYQLSNACANEVPTEDGENLTSAELPTTSNNNGPLTNLPSVNNESILDVEDSQPIVFSNNTELNVRQPEPNGELSPNSYQLSNAWANEVPTEDGENLTSDERPTNSNNNGPLTNFPSINELCLLDDGNELNADEMFTEMGMSFQDILSMLQNCSTTENVDNNEIVYRDSVKLRSNDDGVEASPTTSDTNRTIAMSRNITLPDIISHILGRTENVRIGRRNDKCGNTVFHYAIMNEVHLLHLYRQMKRTPHKELVLNARNNYGENLLHYACLHNKSNCIAPLVGMGFGLHEQDGQGRTALHLAIEYNHTECISKIRKVLVSYTTKKEVEAESNEDTDRTIQRLIKMFKVYNDQGLTVLHVALLAKLSELVEAMLAFCQMHKFDVLQYEVLGNGDSVFHLMAKRKLVDMMELLKQYVPYDEKITNYRGETVLDVLDLSSEMLRKRTE